MSKFPNSADFSQSSFVAASKPAGDVISTFGADFGSVDSEAMCGFGDTEENYNPFQRPGHCRCEEHDEDEDDSEEEPVNLTTDTSESVKDIAKKSVEADLKESGASPEKIAAAMKAIDQMNPRLIEQAVADTIATKKADFVHPLLKLQSAKLEGMGDWFSNIRDSVLTSAGNTAQTEATKLATTAVQAAVAPVAQSLATIANSPQAQAAMQKATQTGIAQLQTAMNAKIAAIWNQYKIPVMIGGAAILGGAIYFFAKRKK